MTIKTRTITSSLAALTLAVLLMACPGQSTACSGAPSISELKLDGSPVLIQGENFSQAASSFSREKFADLCSASGSGWVEYRIKTAQTGEFKLTLKLASNATSSLRFELDGTPIIDSQVEVTATGGAFKEMTASGFIVSEGEHTLRVIASAALNLASLSFAKALLPTAYAGTVPSVQGTQTLTLEAEEFDRGGPGVAYFDTSPINTGNGTRQTAVDINQQGDTQYVTDTLTGEWLHYSFNVPQSMSNKRFKIAIRYAANVAGGTFSLSLGGRKLLDKEPVQNTGGDLIWKETGTLEGIAPGPRELTLSFNSLASGASNIMNVDRLEVVYDSDVVPGSPPDKPLGVVGKMSLVYDWPLIPIHAALMPDGKVFSWGGGKEPKLGQGEGGEFMVWDPAQGDAGGVTKSYYSETSLFCAGFSHLPDGRLLIAGGHYTNFQGVRDTNIFDFKQPVPSSITPQQAMFDGRWYPSATPLANGEIMVSEGYSAGDVNGVPYAQPERINTVPEVWKTNNGGGWRELSNAEITTKGETSYYPFMYPNKNGEVIRVGPEPTMYAFETNGIGKVTKLQNRDTLNRDYGTAAMFTPGKILLAGGGGSGTGTNDPFPSKTAVVVDISKDPITVTPTLNSMSNGRRHLSSTILPTGDVLISAGTSGKGHNNEATFVYPLELYSASSNKFTTLTNVTKGRGYHSIGLLLPDARVLIGGGGNCGCTYNENNVEFFDPPYFFESDGANGQRSIKESRPSISSITTLADVTIGVDSPVNYGQAFKLVFTSPAGRSITRVTMIKLGAVTHARNFDQNFNELSISASGASSITVTAPLQRNWATPGHYMVFAIDSDGVPSVAKIIKLQ